MATTDFELVPTDEQLVEASGGDVLANGGTMQRMQTPYATAISVQQPRNLAQKRNQLMSEARLGGESFYYGWGTGKDRVIGPSVGLAMSAARVWGNCAVEPQPIQETESAWVLSCHFIDLETGFTLGRQFRQAKKWTVYGKFDSERKDDIRFQIGQSKAARNVICNALPRWLIEEAVKEAQKGVRERIEKYVEEKGLAAAVDVVIEGLAKQGVVEQRILDKCEVAQRSGLSLDHVVMLRGDLYALQNGMEREESLFPPLFGEKSGAESDLNAALDADAGAGQQREVEPEKAKVEKKKRGGRKKAAKPKPPAPESDASATDVAQDASTGEAAPDQSPTAEAPQTDAQDPNDEVYLPDESDPTPPADEETSESPSGTEPASSGGAPGFDDFPEGFLDDLDACNAQMHVDQIQQRYEGACSGPEVWEALRDACNRKREEIRSAFRNPS